MTLANRTTGVSKIKSRRPIFILAMLALVLGLAVSGRASANIFDEQTNRLSDANNQNEDQISDLQVQATDLKGQISNLDADIFTLQNQLNVSRDKQKFLQSQLDQTQTKIDGAKKTLGSSIRALYLDSQVSTLEMVAGSKDLSDYFNKARYREIIRAKVTSQLENVKVLQDEWQKQKGTADKVVADQQNIQQQLQAKSGQTKFILSLNQGQQVSFVRTILTNNDRINELRRIQAVVNAQGFIGRWTTGGSGNYPWATAAWPNRISDPWGMYLRQCVSYAAWKVANSGRYMPFWGGRGNANKWDDNARAAGIPVDTTPREGDIAISNAGSYGHAMYVEAVNDDGTITVSQYNAGWDGLYSVGRRYVGGLVFIHF